jgi:transposase
VLKVELTQEEREILEGHYKKSNVRLVRERAHALLLSDAGGYAPDIAGILFRADNTIREWLRAFNTNRISSIFPGYENNGNASKLTKERREEIKEIKPFLANPTWEVFVSDEVRIVWESEIRRAWLKKGEKTVLKVHRAREYQNFIGMLSEKTGRTHLYPLAWQEQGHIIEALKKLKAEYPHKKICLIWDNARWHKGKLLRSELSRGKSLENFHLINFPPYAPDKNSQEHVWKDAKEKIANTVQESFVETVALFTATVLGRTYDYRV